MEQFGGSLFGDLAALVIAQRRGYVSAPLHLLHYANVCARIQQVRDKGVLEITKREVLHADLLRPLEQGGQHCLIGHSSVNDVSRLQGWQQQSTLMAVELRQPQRDSA
jgi:hypothetical protein